MRSDDTFWAATKLAAISDDTIKAAVTEAKFGDPAGEAFLAKAISERRLRILQAFLPMPQMPVSELSEGLQGRPHESPT